MFDYSKAKAIFKKYSQIITKTSYAKLQSLNSNLSENKLAFQN